MINSLRHETRLAIIYTRLKQLKTREIVQITYNQFKSTDILAVQYAGTREIRTRNSLVDFNSHEWKRLALCTKGYSCVSFLPRVSWSSKV